MGWMGWMGWMDWVDVSATLVSSRKRGPPAKRRTRWAAQATGAETNRVTTETDRPARGQCVTRGPVNAPVINPPVPCRDGLR